MMPCFNVVLELATKAPNGGNEQKAAIVIVKDASARAELARLNRSGFPIMSLYYRRRLRTDAAWARTWWSSWRVGRVESRPGRSCSTPRRTRRYIRRCRICCSRHVR
jgi:hypothetical protein